MSSNINTPMVSVIMPAYNAETQIAPAIESVLNQTYKNLELIILDDGSTDATSRIIQHYSQRDPRITALSNPCNLGVARTRNIGFMQARGDYIALLDSDDFWVETKLEQQVACAQVYNADIVCCSYSIVDAHGQACCPDFIVPETVDFSSMLVRSSLNCSTVLMARHLVEQFSFPTNLYHEDLAFWLQLLKAGLSAVGLQEVLAFYRLRPGSRASNKLCSAYNRWRIYRQFLGFSRIRSLGLLVRYTVLGFWKYRRICGVNHENSDSVRCHRRRKPARMPFSRQEKPGVFRQSVSAKADPWL